MRSMCKDELNFEITYELKNELKAEVDKQVRLELIKEQAKQSEVKTKQQEVEVGIKRQPLMLGRFFKFSLGVFYGGTHYCGVAFL